VLIVYPGKAPNNDGLGRGIPGGGVEGVTMVNEKVILRLTKEESLVLLEWLAGLDSVQAPAFDHPSEERVLWKLRGLLESTLNEPLLPDYKDIIAAARRSVETDNM